MRLDLSRFRRRSVAAMAIGAVAVAGVAVLPVLPAFAATGCAVTYTVGSSWPGNFSASTTIRNLGDPITSWTLEWDFGDAGQHITQANLWNGTVTQTGQHITVTNVSYNGTVATNAFVSPPPGFNGQATGANPVPTAFKLNGVACTGSVGGTTAPPTTRPPTTPPTTRPPTTPPTTRPPTTPPTTRPPTTPPTTRPPTTPPTTPPTNPPPGTHVDNPYSGATGYVNPEWAAKAAAEPGGNRVSGVSTAVWLDSIGAIAGSSTSLGLAGHLDAALAQKGSGPETIQIVIYDLPGRDCAALASNGELAPTDINGYEHSYIDPIAAIVSQAKYASLRIVAVIEIDSLPNLVTNTNGTNTATPQCNTMLQNGNYVTGIAYALGKLHAAPANNVYNYIDAAHHGWIGWSSNFAPTATLLASTAQSAVGGKATVDGFIVNTANYSALSEPFFTINTSIGGQPIRNTSHWVDFNDYVDELTFAQAFRNQLVSDGFASNIGMLIDTSRNGWGGPNRPTAASTSTDGNTFVEASRIDRRPHLGDWCNQSGAGLGERPRAAPATGIDAYVWVKPPGESDGSSSLIPTGPNNPGGKGFDQMCDPTYGGNARNGNSPSGALANAPVSGAWFSAQFQQLMTNAFPPLS